MPPGRTLEAQAKLVGLMSFPISEEKFSQKEKERTTWGDQVSVNKAHTLFSKVVFIPYVMHRG